MQRPKKAALIVLIFAIMLLTSSLAFAWLHLISASDGARLGPVAPFSESAWRSDGVLATPLQNDPNGLHQDDLIVAVGGVTIEAWMQALMSPDVERPQWKPDQYVVYKILRDGHPLDVSVRLREYPLSAVLASAGTFPIVMLIFQCIAAYIFWRRPENPVTRIVFLWAASVSTFITALSLGLQISDIVGGTGFLLFKLASLGAFLLAMCAALRFAVLFPQPYFHIFRPHRGLVAWFVCAVPGAVFVFFLAGLRPLAPNMLVWISWWDSSWPILILVYLSLIIAVIQCNYANASFRDAVAWQQARLVVFAITLAGALAFIFGLLPRIFLGYMLVDRNVLSLFPLVFLMAFAVAILRYRLFDIDILINRTLVYGTLTTLVIAIYMLVVSTLSILFEVQNSLPTALVATGIVAVLFQPLRERLQHSINRLMYGERDDPYAVLAQLGQRVEVALSPDVVLPTIVETVAHALKLPYVAINLKQEDALIPAAAYGLPQDDLLHLPLVYQREAVGELIVSSRSRGEVLSPMDRRVLDDLAHQVSVAAHAVRLTADLQRSREQLVTAREEERRRLRRDLHDGFGPTLASLTLKLDAASNLLTHDLSAVNTLLTEARVQSEGVITDIRRLVYELRPPALDDLGLIAALETATAHYRSVDGLRITVEAPDYLPLLPAAVEVAAYRIALEALHNVVRHAKAQTCAIRLALSDALYLDVIDDGCGLSVNHQVGVGLSSMRERATELGGTCVIGAAGSTGTRVTVRLPLPRE